MTSYVFYDFSLLPRLLTLLTPLTLRIIYIYIYIYRSIKSLLQIYISIYIYIYAYKPMFLRRFSHTIAPISPDLFLFINNNFFKRRPIQKIEMRKNRNLKKNLIYFSTKIFVPLFLIVMLDPTL